MSIEEIKDRNLNFAVLTVSDTRTIETDKGGAKVIELLKQSNQNILFYEIVKDDYKEIKATIEKWGKESSVDCIITTGGTGIAKRDVTIEAVNSLLEKEIPGFGEIFRFLSFTDDIGTRAIASRTVAGIYLEKLIFSLPGSVGAVTLGMERLVLPEMRHLVREITK